MTTVKVLCGTCGRLLGRVTVTPHGRAYEVTAGHGGTANMPSGMWCPVHGWPDLDDPKLAARLDAADGRIVTHRARMMPRPPVPR